MPTLSGNFAHHHIDGHLALIYDKDQEPVLLAAHSYFHQNPQTTIAVGRIRRELGVDRETIDDYTLPPLALNLLQLDTGDIIMTSQADVLERRLKDMVGADRVHTTEVPIIKIPNRARGSIRCMTNIVPVSLLETNK